jgi:hypothetical protein
MSNPQALKAQAGRWRFSPFAIPSKDERTRGIFAHCIVISPDCKSGLFVDILCICND